MIRHLPLLTAFLCTIKIAAAQERSFSFGVGPAVTYGFTQQVDDPVSRGYSSRFRFMTTSKTSVLKGVSIDLTEVSTMDTAKVTEFKRTYVYRIRHNYGHPAIALTANLGREIRKGGSSLSYYGSAGPVFGFSSNGSIGLMVGGATRYFYYLEKNIAIGVEVSPRVYYIRMFNPPARMDHNAVFATLPATINFCFTLGNKKKKQSEEQTEVQAE
ncbi:hypothetical protein [Polluticoccus soli]|uniref:hypothetical protein n=1 Tax=Polluticoccus soli TaxID=3034150 RepID=UPI0023E2D3AD|nr:hypothetical protein [Flavipsychrobacter sp. JY13-12]